MLTIFAYNAVAHNPAFAAGLHVAPPAAVSTLNPGRKPRPEGPTDADRIEWYFRDEIAAANAALEAAAQ